MHNTTLKACTPPPGQREQTRGHAYSTPLGTHWYPPSQGETCNNHPKNQNLKANVNIASLKVNSYTAPASNMSGIEKWSTIYQTMKENKIAILAVQETHLDDTLVSSLGDCFRKRLEIINSQLPANPQSSAGVAFVINKNLIAPCDTEKFKLIEGQVIAIKFKWHENDEIVIINMYTLNNRTIQYPPGILGTPRCQKENKGTEKTRHNAQRLQPHGGHH